MCPLWPLHLLFLYILACAPILLMCISGITAAANASVKLLPDKLEKLAIGSTTQLTLMTSPPTSGDPTELMYHVTVDRGSGGQRLAEVTPRDIVLRVDPSVAGIVNTTLNITALSLGYTRVTVRTKSQHSSTSSGNQSQQGDGNSGGGGEVVSSIPVSVVRNARSRSMDTVFGALVAVLMTLTYVNMGCTLDLTVIKGQLQRPIGPAIGVFCQYIIMPLLGFGLALLTVEDPGLQLGLFLTGCSPGGGASNIWTYLLDANVNLSVAMTFVSSLIAFIAVPAWVYLLGGSLMDNTVVVPYSKIVTLLISLIIPCTIGVLLQRYLPRVAKVLRVVFKPWSVVLFIFILAFGIYCNLQIFYNVTWQLVVGAGCLPMLGFIGGAVMSLLTGRNWQDGVAISIETGVQNTGVAIYMLKFSLPEPANDLSILAPILVASMTPLPLFTAMLVRKVRALLARGGVCGASSSSDSPLHHLASSERPLKKHPGAGGCCGDCGASDDERCHGNNVLVSVSNINSVQP